MAGYVEAQDSRIGNFTKGAKAQLETCVAYIKERDEARALRAQVQSLQRQLASARALNDAIESRCDVLSSIAAKVPGLEKQVERQKEQIADLESQEDWNAARLTAF